MLNVLCNLIGCCVVFETPCLFSGSGWSHHVGEETDGQVREREASRPQSPLRSRQQMSVIS